MVISWGIIGIGAFADNFMGPAIGKAADTDLVAVCSRNIERAKSFAAKHGVKRAKGGEVDK